MKKAWNIFLLMFGLRKRSHPEVQKLHAQWREQSKVEDGIDSFVSGITVRTEKHHGFSAHLFPCFIFSSWNDWTLTYNEHRGTYRSFHSWERRNFKRPLARMVMAHTPIGLYIWKYFYYHWHKGLCVLLVPVAIWLTWNYYLV